jgi:hypothetical protein
MEEKVKLISLNEKQWHYRLIKFVFGNSMPEPKTLKNLCPYFWIWIASMILVVPVTPFKLLFWLFKVPFILLEKFANSRFIHWVETLSPDEAFDLYEYNYNESIKRTKKSKDYSDRWLLDTWAKVHGLDIADPDYAQKLEAYFAEIREAREAKLEIKRQELYVKDEAAQRRRKLERERRERIEARMRKIGNFLSPINTAFESVRNSVKFDNYNQVIKATKRFVGLIITCVIAFVLAYCSQLLTCLALVIINAWNTAAVLTGLFTYAKALGIAIAIGLPLGILVWAVLHIVEGWTEKRHIPWYAKPFIFMGNVIYSLGLYLLYYPIYFIVISVIWNFICVSLIYGAGKGLVVGFMKFGGLFGEYFSASYTDMCPSIDWVDEEGKQLS